MNTKSLIFVITLATTTSATFAQSARNPNPAAPRPNEVTQPDRDKSLIQESDAATQVIEQDTENDPHFTVQPPIPGADDSPVTEGERHHGHSRPRHEDADGTNAGHFQIGFGYTHSRWSQFSSTLKDGSFDMRLGIFRQWDNFDGGLVLNVISAAEGNQGDNENLYATSFGAEGLYKLGGGHVKGLAGLGLHVGDYRAWSLANETDNEITYTKHSSRYLLGLTPGLGVRFEVSSFFAIDLMAQYLGFLDKPNYRVGGWNAMINLNFVGRRGPYGGHRR